MSEWERWAIAGGQVIQSGATIYGAASDIAGGGLSSQDTATGLGMIWTSGVRAMGTVYEAYQDGRAPTPQGYQSPQYVPGAPGAAGSRKSDGGGLIFVIAALVLLSGT
jgi:hypothetical protein